MKRKLIIVLILALIIIAVTSASILIYQNSKIVDYTKYSEADIFYTSISSSMEGIEKDYSFKDQDYKNILYIKTLDNNLNPITEAVYELYDSEGYFIVKLNANSIGDIAINNLENNKKYHFIQTKTREGLEIDDTLYYFEITNDDSAHETIRVNSNKKMSTEEQDEILKGYKYEDVIIKENESNDAKVNQRYILLKGELKGLVLDILETNNEYLTKDNIKISDSEIINCKINKDNKLIITFKYNNKIYKIMKEYN